MCVFESQLSMKQQFPTQLCNRSQTREVGIRLTNGITMLLLPFLSPY